MLITVLFWEEHPLIARIVFLLAYIAIMAILLVLKAIGFIFIVVMSVIVAAIFIVRRFRGEPAW